MKNLKLGIKKLPNIIVLLADDLGKYEVSAYGGLVRSLSLKGNYEYKGEKDTFKPKELNLHTYNLGARFGMQFDLAMFNFDFSYTIGITNAFKNSARTNTQGLNFNVGFVF